MRLLARQMSGPVPSPSMNGTIGWLGTLRRPSVISMRWPSLGGVNCSSTDIGRPSCGTARTQTASSVAQIVMWWQIARPGALTRRYRAAYARCGLLVRPAVRYAFCDHTGTQPLPTGPTQPGVYGHRPAD